MLKCLQRIEISAALRDLALFKLLQEFRIVRRIAQNRRSAMILRCSSDQGDTSNIDFLHSFRNCDIDLSNCVLEWVQVANNVVDLVDILFGEVLLIGGKVACENTGVDGRVKSLDSTS